MKDIRLTQRQKNLLYQLAEHKQHGRLMEPFGIIPTGPSEYVIYLRNRPSMRLRWASDLDALCVSGYLEYSWNRLSNGKLYVLSKAAQLAFKSGELLPVDDDPDSLFAPSPPNGRVSSIFKDRAALLHEVETVRAVLKQELGAVLEGELLGDAIAELTAVQNIYYMVTPDTAVVSDILHRLGRRITEQLAEAESLEGKTAVAQALTTFGAWSRLIFQVLLQTPQRK